ncbi:DNA topoisomerase IB [Sphingomonas nostoxanthinifaciens]|uniref:DNA topoisomerase IB n=1 Tax=Sphingomonas nostoxanthinifaciens TaxID=2872652 RepID=UPI001CC21F60|nr:DNA topoisomerase IB [Sphingomonas nostoxanthinifaciens]UAK24628.1 DNA topoisomerase IB [Sphingomonas nostoxanthinifaciens]
MAVTKLRHVDDSKPGITRRKAGHGWAYSTADGTRITDRDEIDRLNAVALPPAYCDAWYSPWPNGHIQATGIDDKGRKQYRYHPDFRAQQEAEKYERCAEFGRALPKLRARVEQDLAGRMLARDTVIAAVVRLLDLGHIRVGNEAYAKENKSFGATTLRNRHARVAGARLKLEYVGKSGKTQRLTIEDKRLARIVRRTQDLPGQRLFEYLDSDATPHPVDSVDVNDYIRDATGGDFTAKHFRTWGASLLAFEQILEAGRDRGKLSLKPMLEAVAAALGNTPAISRKSYVHPALIELCRTGDATGICALRLPRATKRMTPTERALIGFLDEIAAIEARQAA